VVSLAAFPVDSRVRVVGSAEWVSDDGMRGRVGTVVAHDDPYLVVAIDDYPAPEGDDGCLLEPSEVEPAS